MEEPKSTAGQGLGIAGLVLGILAIPLGIIPCTFLIGILFGIVGIVLSLVALSQANRGAGAKGLIIAALVCSIVGVAVASAVGFTGAKFVRELIREGDFNPDALEEIGRDAGEIFEDLESDTTETPRSTDMDQITDTLKALEGEEEDLE